MTKAQQHVYDRLQEWFATSTVAPTQEQLATACGLRSTAGVGKHLRRLRAQGYLTFESHRKKSIALVTGICPACGRAR